MAATKKPKKRPGPVVQKLIPIADVCREGCQLAGPSRDEAKVASREDVKDVYGEGLTVGRQLANARMAAALQRIVRLCDALQREPVQSVSIKRRAATLIRAAAEDGLRRES